MKRRVFLSRAAAAAAACASQAGRSSSSPAAEDAPPRTVRVGIVGLGNRGAHLLRLLLGVPGVRVTALCDSRQPAVGQAAAIVREAGGGDPWTTRDYPDLVRREDVDLVVVATPTRWHCSMSIEAMKAGKHVGCEVPAGFELTELSELVRTKESTRRRYMLLENYAYARANLALWILARSGTLGDLYYAECSYIHDCRFMLFRDDGSLDWWGEWVTKNHGNDYPTHAIGPVAKWLGIHEGDRLERCSSLMTDPRVLKLYARRRFGPESPQARIPFVQGDFIATLVRTARGRVVRVDYDPSSPRPASIYNLVQGTLGVFDSRAGLYLDGAPEERWRPVGSWLDENDHPWWRRHGAEASAAGHGGADWFVVRDLVRMARDDREPWIDVYDAAAWSALFACSRASIDRNGDSVEIPDFTGGMWKDGAWRAGNLRPEGTPG